MKAKLFISALFLLSLNVFPQTINFGISQAPQNIHPLLGRDAASEKIIDLVYEKVFHLNENFEIKSQFVDVRTDSNKTYILSLKSSDNFFSNGQILSIKDIYFSIEWSRKFLLSKHADDLKNIKSIEQKNEKIYIELIKEDANFLTRLMVPIVPYNIDELGINLSKKSLGSNNFKIVHFKPDLILKRSDGLMIKFIEIKDPSVRALKLINKEIDLLQNDLSLPVIKLLENQKDVYVNTIHGNNVSYLGFNHQDKFLKNYNLRKAIMHGIDRNTLIKYFLNHKTVRANQLLPREHWAHEDINVETYDPQLSLDYLEKSGFKLPLTLEFKTSTDTFRIKIATIIQAQLKKIGINLKIVSLDWGTYYKDIQQGNFQLYSLTWVGLNSPDIYKKIFHSQMTPPNGLNRGSYRDKRLDIILSNSELSNNWKPAIRYVRNQVLMLPLWYEGNYAATASSVKYFYPQKDGGWNSLNVIKKTND